MIKGKIDTKDWFFINDYNSTNPCYSWEKYHYYFIYPKISHKATWDVQATAPLMLEAVQDLLVAHFRKEDHPLLPRNKKWMKNAVYVQENWLDSAYFQGAFGSSNWATKDVRGFLSIVLTNIKEARKLTASIFRPFKRFIISTQGPKVFVWLMPRHYWTSVFSLIEEKLPPNFQLWEVLEHLACYQNTKDGELKLDKRFCTGEVDNPQPNGELQDKTWSLWDDYDPLSVKRWVESIVNQPAGSPDALSAWDAKHFDGQIGAFDKLGKPFERVIDSRREVPIWEFRGLRLTKKASLPGRLAEIQSEVIKFHRKYPQEPTS
ncbi:hypothetical protein CTA2_6963 [Colletotrichum tanaceti]|uniref:Uncharacterized protein n=1 Tax=Colletotrichum tanaceti TaxID=1306861 RepID=A0A4U6XSK5_9PEZI|nr:hypothetical protein CTA2_6963 [Colletotrichum tanaceti]TKW58852.1 hypothetical protein CTA1_8684 [Colletotrichum tanaceti]